MSNQAISIDDIKDLIRDHEVEPRLAKSIINYVMHEKPTMEKKTALSQILIHKINNPTLSIAEMVESMNNILSQEPWKSHDDSFLLLSIALAFVSTGRNDLDTYQDFIDNFAFYENPGFENYPDYVKLLRVPYVYSKNEIPVLKRIAEYMYKKDDEHVIQKMIGNRIYNGNDENLIEKRWFQVYMVYIVRDAVKRGKLEDKDIDKYRSEYKNIFEKCVNSLMSIRPGPSVFVDAKDLLTPRDYIEYMYKKKWYKYSGLQLTNAEKEAEIDDFLYIDYQTPGELEKLFDLKKPCNTYLMYIGEYHGKTRVQNFGFDPRFGYGEVQLPFDVALVSEEPPILPTHLYKIAPTWGIPNVVDDLYDSIAAVEMNYNKMAVCMQILENRPITGYVPKVNARLYLAYKINNSKNFMTIRILYGNLNSIAMGMRKSLNDQLFIEYMNKIIKLRKYIFGVESAPNVKEYPSDIRRPYESSPLWKSFMSLSEHQEIEPRKYVLPMSYKSLVCSCYYNPDKDAYYYYRYLIKWNTIYASAFITTYDGILDVSYAREIEKMGIRLLADPNFNTIIDEYTSIFDVDFRATCMNIIMKHPELDENDLFDKLYKNRIRVDRVDIRLMEKLIYKVHPDLYENITRRMSDEIRKQRLVEKLNKAHLANYIVFEDEYNANVLSSHEINTFCTFVIYCHMWISYLSANRIKRPMNSKRRQLFTNISIAYNKIVPNGTVADFTREVICDADVPYGFDSFDWNYIGSIFDDEYSDNIPNDKITKEVVSRNFEEDDHRTAMTLNTNIGFMMRIKQLLESPNPPKLIIVPCGSAHAMYMQIMFKRMAAKKGFKLHECKKHNSYDLDVEIDKHKHVL